MTIKAGDRVKIIDAQYRDDMMKHLIGNVYEVSRIDNAGWNDRNIIIYDDNGMVWSFNDDEVEVVEPEPRQDWVTVDANGEVKLPSWVKPGYYKRTDNPDGSFLLEPLMTKSEWEATK